MQASSSFDGMGSKSKVADMNDAFCAADTMSTRDMFDKNPKKKTCKAANPSSDVAPKGPKPSSIAAVAPTLVTFASIASPDAFGSQ